MAQEPQHTHEPEDHDFNPGVKTGAAIDSAYSAGRAVKNVFVVLVHKHEDNYKCVESGANVEAAFSDERAAVEFCLYQNALNTLKYESDRERLYEIDAIPCDGDSDAKSAATSVSTKHWKTLEQCIKGKSHNDGPTEYDRQKVADWIAGKTLEQLRDMHRTYRKYYDQLEGEFTFKPTMHVRWVSEQVVNKPVPLDYYDGF